MPSVPERRAAGAGSALSARFAAILLTATVAHATEPAPAVPPAATAAPTNATPTSVTPDSGKPSREEIVAAVEKLRADPNLGTTEKKRQLRRNNTEPAEPQKVDPNSMSWLKWIADAFKWFASTARVLLWVIAILLAGVLGLFIKRFVESRGEQRSRPVAFTMPTHVQDLDIRPESLPDDIGGTALGLWNRGEHRAALALLYRGLLSRLAHVHGVPIRDSSTEGDCLTLAAERLALEPAAYAAQLIRLWQRAVYGDIEPTPEEFHSVSMGFAAAVDHRPTTAPVEQAA